MKILSNLKPIVISGLLLVILISFSNHSFAQKRGKRTTISLTDNVFYLRCVQGGKYIDIPGYAQKAKKDNGSNVVLWDLDDGMDRRVKFIPTSEGYYNIQFQHAKMNMDVHGCYADKWFCGTYKKDKGANVQIWSSGSSKPQQWKLEQVNPGQFKIRNKYSGKVLDAVGSKTGTNGCNVAQWTDNNGKNQLWEIVDVKTGNRYQQ